MPPLARLWFVAASAVTMAFESVVQAAPEAGAPPVKW